MKLSGHLFGVIMPHKMHAASSLKIATPSATLDLLAGGAFFKSAFAAAAALSKIASRQAEERDLAAVRHATT